MRKRKAGLESAAMKICYDSEVDALNITFRDHVTGSHLSGRHLDSSIGFRGKGND